MSTKHKISAWIGCLAVLLSFLVAGMMNPVNAFAADIADGDVNVTISDDSQVNVDFKAYRIMKSTYHYNIDKLSDSDVAYVSADAQKAFNDALSDYTGNGYSENAYAALQYVYSDHSNSMISSVARYVQNELSPDYTVSTKSTVTVPSGLYVFLPANAVKNGSDNTQSVMPIIALLDGNTDTMSLSVKNTAPSVDKTVNNVKTNVAGVFDTLQYDILVELPENYDAFDEYPLSVQDTLSNGLTLDENSIYVTDSEGRNIDASQYTLSVSQNGSDKSIVVDFSNLKNSITSSQIASGLHLKYSASVNADALIGNEMPNENTVKIEYQHSPYDKAHVMSIPSLTKTYAMSLNIQKIDNDSKDILNGARVSLHNIAHNMYWTGSEWSSQYCDFELNDTVSISAISAGDYELKETQAPEGYALMKGTAILTVSLGADASGNLIYNVQASSASGAVSVEQTDAGQGYALVSIADEPASTQTIPEQIQDNIQQASNRMNKMFQTGDAISDIAIITACVALCLVALTQYRKHKNQ